MPAGFRQLRSWQSPAEADSPTLQSSHPFPALTPRRIPRISPAPITYSPSAEPEQQICGPVTADNIQAWITAGRANLRTKAPARRGSGMENPRGFSGVQPVRRATGRRAAARADRRHPLRSRVRPAFVPAFGRRGRATGTRRPRGAPGLLPAGLAAGLHLRPARRAHARADLFCRGAGREPAPATRLLRRRRRQPADGRRRAVLPQPGPAGHADLAAEHPRPDHRQDHHGHQGRARAATPPRRALSTAGSCAISCPASSASSRGSVSCFSWWTPASSLATNAAVSTT